MSIQDGGGGVSMYGYPEISYNFYDVVAMGLRLLLLFDNVSQGFPTH